MIEKIGVFERNTTRRENREFKFSFSVATWGWGGSVTWKIINPASPFIIGFKRKMAHLLATQRGSICFFLKGSVLKKCRIVFGTQSVSPLICPDLDRGLMAKLKR